MTEPLNLIRSWKLPRALQALNDAVLEDKQFIAGYGSADQRFSHIGGLLEHTAEVVDIAAKLAASADEREALITAAVWHDSWKKLAYALSTGSIYQTAFYRMTGPAWSYADFTVKAARRGFSEGWITDVGHAILSVSNIQTPQTRLAMLLRAADAQSEKGLYV